MSLDIESYGSPGHVINWEPIPFNLPIQHWSPSSLSKLQRCPRQWQEYYIHGRRERPGESILVGSAVHSAVEMNFGQKIESHEDVAITELLDYYGSTFPVIVEREQERAGEEAKWDTTPARAQERGKAILAGYQSQVAGRIQPLAVETAISIDLGLGVPIEGRFDVEREDSVIDLKSGKKATYKPKEDWRIQAVVYGAAKNKPVEFHSATASAVTNKVTIVTPLEAEAMLLQPSVREREELLRTLKALAALATSYMAEYGPDEPWPTMGVYHAWACDYCGYRNDCPAWQR
jgi:CRISPR/Cas system-associated exonuclease Cas4 (RecB family)